jgi:putative PIN family toxin of toxin-antitoxin system
MTIDIVLDTNVLITALKSSRGTSYQLLALLEDNQFRVHISTTLVAEYEAVLKRGLLSLSETQIDDVLDFLCARATHHSIYYLWRPILKDPGDDFVLELAVKSQARIITWNIIDFKRAKSLGVLVQTPREFLDFLKGKTT